FKLFTVPENVTLHVDQSELQEQPLPTEAGLVEGRAELLSSRGSNSTAVEDGARAVELSHSKDVVTDNTSCHYAGDTENENHLLLSTDRGSYSMETSQPTTDIRDFILQYGPFQPDTHFSENAQGRQFSATYYNLKTKTGLDIRRKWLCYSLQLDKAYCETCWLFANRSSPQFRPEWILGVSDWQHLSQKISRHETSLSHIQAMRDRMNYEENRSIKSALNEETAREADKWRQVLKRIFMIIISLASSNNPLRGHTEKLEDPNPGNFLREVKLLAEFDPKKEEVAEATGIKNRLENFQFIIILVFWDKDSAFFNLLSKKLQTVELHLDECVVMWQNGIQSLQDLEKNLLSVQDEAKEIASKWGVPAVFHHQGIDTARRTIMSEESLFEATLRPVIVNVIFQMKARFECTHSIFELFSFLTPSKILSLPENELSVKVN
ncbi:Zinc finger MYM-type protein 5, partial [Orchesella cincta]